MPKDYFYFMNKLLTLFFAITFILGAIWAFGLYKNAKDYGAPPYVEDIQESETPTNFFDEYYNWTRPNGPIKIGLQAGHWKTDEMPEEQTRIRKNGGGTSGQGVAEWKVVLKIAEETAKILEEQGYIVDILPATVPVDYWADAFISIHADGNVNPIVNGYKTAAYQRDRTGNAQKLSNYLQEEYGKITNLPVDPNITRNMTRYYAFNSRRYEHAIHPMTPGVLVETGFMTNYKEATMLINSPEVPAQGIANGIVKFIQSLNIEKSNL
ncbi:MAG: N-acetylmuramoyl-L-alanine amidase family protein [Patescibacteria group bacterium]